MADFAFKPGKFVSEAHLAITDFRFYRSVFQQPLSLSLVYLLGLVALSALVLTVAFGLRYLPDAYRFLDWASENFPRLEVQNGRLLVEGNQPVVLEYMGDEIYTFVFDTRTGDDQPLHRLNEPAIVFARDNLYFVVGGQVHPWPWSQLASVRIGRQEITDLKDLVRWGYYPLGGLVFFVTGLFSKGLQALLLTFFAFSGAARHGFRLSFSTCLTIAIYSLTPAVALDILVILLGQEIPYFGIIYMLTASIYTYQAAQRCVVMEV